MIIEYKNIPCPVLEFEEPDSYLIMFKEEQRWIFKCSKGYGEISKDEYGIFYEFEGEYHREKGPSCKYIGNQYCNGDQSWYKYGRLHRLDGPAAEHVKGNKYWYIDGKKYYEEEYWKKIEEMKSNGIYNL